eukprot:jgi/Psemu1/57559/gm1.57559_g
MVDPFDWNAIEGIRFRFKGNSPYDAQLNDLYSQIMDDIDMEDLFVKNADAKVLAPFMMTNLRGSVVNAITYCLPSLTASQKGHITQLLSGCTISYVTYTGATKKVRGPIDLEKAAKEALIHHAHASTKPIITIELVITEWQFKSTWRAHRFDKVYAIPIPVPSSCVNIPPFNPRESPVEPTIPVPSQTNNALTFNDKLIEQLKRERNGETVQQVLPPKRKRPKTTRPATGCLNPIKPIESEVEPTIQVREQCTFESSNNTSPVIVPSGTTDLVHSGTKTIDPNNVETSLNSTALSNPHYTWTWTYSPNSESVSFRRIHSVSFHRLRSNSISFRRSTSSSSCHVQCQDKSTVTTSHETPSDAISFHRASSPSPPVQRQDKSPVTALSITPSALTRPGQHSPPPWEPANFQWTFHPQSETLVFHRLPKPASVPLTPSLRLPLPKTACKDSVLASATSMFTYHSAYLCRFCHVTCSNSNQTVVCLTKRHRDALKIKLYHLHSNVLSMNWFYDTFD